MEWLAFTPLWLTASAIVLIPGLALGAALRLRGMLLWAFAPAAGAAVLAVIAILAPLAGVTWSVWTMLAAAAAVTGIAAIIGRWLTPTSPTRPAIRGALGTAVALTAGSVLGVIRMAAIIGQPGHLSQTNDATFHLNALRFIREGGDASSFGLLGTLDATGFYPAAWHAIASLLMQVTGSDVVSAANATSLAMAGPLWTLSITGFVWTATRRNRTAAAFAAIMSPALFAFPFHVLDFGVLYPYTLSVAVLPGVLALLIGFANEPPPAHADRSRRIVLHAISTAIGLAGIALSQPSTLLTWIVGAVAILIGMVVSAWPAASPSRRRMLVIGVGTGVR